MARRTSYWVVLVVLLVGVSMLGANDRRPGVRAARRAEPAVREADPHLNRTVLVEAYVVEVDLAALYGMGVNPLGQAPHSVSVENLQAYLRTGEKANVLVGTKAAAAHGTGRNTAERSETSYYPRRRVIDRPDGKQAAVDYAAYETGETLNVTPTIVSERTIKVGYSFSYSGPRTVQQPSEGPFDTVSWSWNGITLLGVGQPRIVGATQDSEDAIFFVLTAHVLD